MVYAYSLNQATLVMLIVNHQQDHDLPITMCEAIFEIYSSGKFVYFPMKIYHYLPAGTSLGPRTKLVKEKCLCIG
jgi:hypothetical protein